MMLKTTQKWLHTQEQDGATNHCKSRLISISTLTLALLGLSIPTSTIAPSLAAPTCGVHGRASAQVTRGINALCVEVNKRTWYTWGGGHGSRPGASYGHLQTGNEAQTKNDPKRKGFDCSGFSRWFAYNASGRDLLGAGTANTQFNSRLVSARFSAAQGYGVLQPGDLLYYGAGRKHHVAIYLGQGLIAEAPHSNARVHVTSVSAHNDYSGAIRLRLGGVKRRLY